MSDAERGSEEQQAEAVGGLCAFVEMFLEGATMYSPESLRECVTIARQAEVALAASPPPAPRAAGAGEVLAWVVLANDGMRLGGFIVTEQGRDDAARSVAALNESTVESIRAKAPFRVVPLYAGAAPTPANHEDLIRRLGFDRDTLRSGVDPDGSHSGNGALREWFRAGYLVDTVAPDLDEAITALRAGSAPPSVAGVSEEPQTVWRCKIGSLAHIDLPHGADVPMRQAIKAAFFALTGEHAEFTFSGWAAKLTKTELAVVHESAARTAPAPRDET